MRKKSLKREEDVRKCLSEGKTVKCNGKVTEKY